MPSGLQVWSATGQLVFDSNDEFALFLIDDKYIVGSSVGSGLTYSYPGYGGRKICVNFISPYSQGSANGDSVLSCRISYPGGVPTVRVFVDNEKAGLYVAHGRLSVFGTGAMQ